MSILHEHFERVARLQEQGLPITRGLYVDVSGTLIVTQGINEPLVDFLRWNNEKKHNGDNHVFTADLVDAERMINEVALDLSAIGVERAVYKQATYNNAFNKQHAFNMDAIKNFSADEKKSFKGIGAHCLELVIDDRPLTKSGIKSAPMVVTTWDPYDPAVQDFLEKKEYLSFNL